MAGSWRIADSLKVTKPQFSIAPAAKSLTHMASGSSISSSSSSGDSSVVDGGGGGPCDGIISSRDIAI